MDHFEIGAAMKAMALETRPIPTALSDHDLQARAAKLLPIDLQDAELDAADPHTRLFLLAEYWQRQATKARSEVRNIAEAKRFDRERFDDDASFADWAQSRARHALNTDNPPTMAGPRHV